MSIKIQRIKYPKDIKYRLRDLDTMTILRMRDAWEPLLIGELVFRQYPEFTMRALAQCLLALSGSVFLLIIRWVVASGSRSLDPKLL